MLKTDRVPFGVKIGYGLGDLGANFLFQPIMLYLMFFFTDVFMINASTAGAIYFCSKLWDSVTDPTIGFLSDRTRTRWGRKRPYLLFGSFPMGLFFFLLFFAPDLSAGLKPIYALVALLLFSTSYTVVNIPYSALTADMTSSSHERSLITGYRMFFALLGTLAAAGLTRPIVAVFGGGATGWRAVGVLYGFLGVVFTLVTFFTVREQTAASAPEGGGFGEVKRLWLENQPFVLLCLTMMGHFASLAVVASMLNYYFKYYLDMESATPAAFLCLYVPAALALPLWVWASQKTTKKAAFNLGMGLAAASLLSLYFVRTYNPVIIWPILAVCGIGMSTIYLSPWSMVPDTVEYFEWKTGKRREGMIYGVFCFVMKLSAAFGGFISGLGLELAGYAPNSAQTAAALTGIRVMTTLVPIGLIAVGMCIISFYPITGRFHERMLREIQLNREGACLNPHKRPYDKKHA